MVEGTLYTIIRQTKTEDSFTFSIFFRPRELPMVLLSCLGVVGLCVTLSVYVSAVVRVSWGAFRFRKSSFQVVRVLVFLFRSERIPFGCHYSFVDITIFLVSLRFPWRTNNFHDSEICDVGKTERPNKALSYFSQIKIRFASHHDETY